MVSLNFLAEDNARCARSYSHLPTVGRFLSLSYFPDKSLCGSLGKYARDLLTLSRVRSTHIFRQKIKRDLFGLSFFWRRTRDSNPRGCYTLLAFQASSLATRSILRIAIHLPFARHSYNISKKSQLCKKYFHKVKEIFSGYAKFWRQCCFRQQGYGILKIRRTDGKGGIIL